MRSLTIAGILVLAASVVACTDMTGPDLSEGIRARPTSPPPDCITVNLDGIPDFPSNADCLHTGPPPEVEHPTGNPL